MTLHVRKVAVPGKRVRQGSNSKISEKKMKSYGQTQDVYQSTWDDTKREISRQLWSRMSAGLCRFSGGHAPLSDAKSVKFERLLLHQLRTGARCDAMVWTRTRGTWDPRPEPWPTCTNFP
jgi:hypothetical protein